VAKNQVIVCSFWFLLFFQFSCQKVKINELIPDSCEVLVRINFPELISVEGRQKFLSDAVYSKWNIRLEDSGLDFFQPAYFFKTSLESEKEYFLLAGIASESNFIKTLEKLNPEGKNTVNSDFQTFDLKNASVVWYKNRCVFYFFNPITGPILKPDQIKLLLEKENLKRRPDTFQEGEMISFRADIQEENTLPMLPPLEASLSGNLELYAEKWKMNAVLHEGQFSTFLLPFEEVLISENEKCFGSLQVKLEYAKLGKLMENYFYIPHLEDLTKILTSIKGPILTSAQGCLPSEMQNDLSLEAELETEKNVKDLNLLYESLGQMVVFKNDLQISNNQNRVRLSSKLNAEFLPLISRKSNEQILLKLDLNQGKSKGWLKLQKGSQKDEIKIHAEILNPEMFDLPESEEFLDNLPL